MTKSKTSTPTPNKTRTILAIDPGFDRAGLAVMTQEGSTPQVLFSECIRTSSKESRDERLLIIGKRIKEVVAEWRPTELAIETLFFNQNVTSGIGVAEARGVIIYESGCAGLAVYEYSPQSIKSATTGYGKASKNSMDMMVRRLVKLPNKAKKIDDEMDAIAVGITHLASRKNI